MRYHYDLEFEEHGKTIIPISLGMIADDGRELYLINKEYAQTYIDVEPYYWKDEPSVITEWLSTNVMNHIDQKQIDLYGVNYKHWGHEVHAFVSDLGRYTSRDEIELMGWYAAYDHVALAQIWGPMMLLPEPIPMFTRELEDFRIGQSTPARDKEKYPEHHALHDAKYQKHIFDTWVHPQPIKFDGLNMPTDLIKEHLLLQTQETNKKGSKAGGGED